MTTALQEYLARRWRFGWTKPHLVKKDSLWHCYYLHDIGIGKTPAEALLAVKQPIQTWRSGGR